MGKPLNVDFGVLAIGDFRSPSAQKYYRVEVPFRTMYEMGLCNTYMTRDQDRKQIAQLMSGSDIIQQWGPFDETSLNIAKTWGDLKPAYKNGRVSTPPVFVMDMDDAIEYCHPFNQAFSVYGIRDWDGSFLEPGDNVVWPKPDGTEHIIWKDQVTVGIEGTVFDIARNIKTITNHYEIGRCAAGVTLTTPALQEIFAEQGIKDTYIFPNSVRPKDHMWPNLAPHDGVRVLWEGGSAHMESWYPIRHAFVDFLKKHPQVKFVSVGTIFPWMPKEIAPEQLEIHDWVDYSNYKLMRAVLDCDINLCPLFDHPFSRSKSAIRWYEGSLGPRPEAALAANVGPYKEIEDGKTGFLYKDGEEMAEKLGALVSNAELRKTLAQNAQEWVLANRSAEKTVPGLFEYYKELKARQRMEALVA
jgi:hypothetical protein